MYWDKQIAGRLRREVMVRPYCVGSLLKHHNVTPHFSNFIIVATSAKLILMMQNDQSDGTDCIYTMLTTHAPTPHPPLPGPDSSVGERLWDSPRGIKLLYLEARKAEEMPKYTL